jgi:signal transduction histidine kinase/ligand-binding sensor domain-containing protein
MSDMTIERPQSVHLRRIFPRKMLVFGTAQALILVSLWVIPSFAQQLSIRRYDTSDGLAHGVVTSIYQDAKGYLWLSTFEGLSRFDGYRFTNYDTRDGLGDPIINHVTEDRQRRLWVATNGGGIACLLDDPAGRVANHGAASAADGRFRSFGVGETRESNQVNRMLFDSQNNVWCLSDFGLYRASMAEGDPRFEAVLAQSSGGAHGVLEDRQGRLWFGLGHELIQVSGNQVFNYGSVGGAGRELITAIIEDRRGRLLVASRYGLFEFSPPGAAGSKQPWRRLPLKLKPGQEISALLQGTTDDLWIGSTAGLIKYKDGQQTEYTTANGLSGSNIRTLGEDRDGNLWIGTQGGGASKLSGETFVSFMKAERLAPVGITGVFEDRQGQIRVILEDRSVAGIDSGEVNRVGRLDYPPANFDSFAIELEGPKTFWLGLSGGWTRIGKPVLRLRSGREIALAGFGPFRVFPVYFLFYEDENGSLWFERSEGKDNLDEGRIYRAETAEGRPAVVESFETGFSRASGFMISDRAGGLWVGRPSVLARLRHGEISRLQRAEGLSETNPRCFFLDSRGWLWIGMRFGGVSMTKEPAAEDPHFVKYSTEQGLASNAVRSIAEDDLGRIYLGTDKGLDEFDPRSSGFRHYTRKDGLAGDDVHHLYKDRTGSIWVSTSLGVSRLDPHAQRRNLDPAPIYFSRVNVAGDDLRLPETGAGSIADLELSGSRNNLLLEFVALSFQGEQKLRYQYKLEGVDPDWDAPTETRSVNYARLAAGSYRFLARAINQEGIVSAEPAALRFRILPPIWRRWWFIGTAGVLAGLLAYSLYRFRLAQLIELERVRTRIATDLHDDIGSSLSRMAILSEVVKRQAGSPPDSAPMLTEIADSARGLIGSMRDIVWSVDPRRDDLNSLISRVRQFASDVLEPIGVKWDLEGPSQPRRIRLGPDERRHLFLIFKEAINNIARHAECSTVCVSIAIDHSELKASVRDDGQGFAPSPDESTATNPGHGHGLSNMRLRARQLGGTLIVESAPGCGTRLDLVIQLKKP